MSRKFCSEKGISFRKWSIIFVIITFLNLVIVKMYFLAILKHMRSWKPILLFVVNVKKHIINIKISLFIITVVKLNKKRNIIYIKLFLTSY